jgi:hypothetical protein
MSGISIEIPQVSLINTQGNGLDQEDRTYSMLDVDENSLGLHHIQLQTNQSIQPLPTDILPLNVGGRFFQTTRGTLTSEVNSKLAFAFQDTNLLAPPQDSNGNYFIDRDPNVFEVILRYLRSGTVNIPSNSSVTREILLEEARYFNLDNLVRMLDTSRVRQEWRLVESTFVQGSDGVRYVGVSDVEIKGLVWDGDPHQSHNTPSSNVLIASTSDPEAGSARAKYETVMTLETMKQLRLLATTSISSGQAVHKERLQKYQALVAKDKRAREQGRPRSTRLPPPPPEKPNPRDLGIIESSVVAKNRHPNPQVRNAPRDPEVIAMKEHLKEKAYPNGWKVVSFGRFLKTRVRHQSVVVLLRRSKERSVRPPSQPNLPTRDARDARDVRDVRERTAPRSQTAPAALPTTNVRLSQSPTSPISPGSSARRASQVTPGYPVNRRT